MNEQEKEIMAIVTDVDGVMTDSGYIYTPYRRRKISVAKRFSSRDFTAIRTAQEAGYLVIILTDTDDMVTNSMLRNINPDYCEIAELRIKAAREEAAKEAKEQARQLDIFAEAAGD